MVKRGYLMKCIFKHYHYSCSSFDRIIKLPFNLSIVNVHFTGVSNLALLQYSVTFVHLCVCYLCWGGKRSRDMLDLVKIVPHCIMDF